MREVEVVELGPVFELFLLSDFELTHHCVPVEHVLQLNP